jgi:hypothetical protein
MSLRFLVTELTMSWMHVLKILDLRSRLPRLAVLFLLALPIVGSATAQAQTLPSSLQGELLGAECSAFPPSGFTCVSAGQGSVTTTCTLQTDGTAVLSFSVTNGVASGPYPGSFSESGIYTLGPVNSGGGGVGEVVIGFSATFSIQSPAGTVTGTKTGTAAQQAPLSHNFCTAFPGQLGNFGGAFASYSATIQTAQGSFRDTGQTLAQVNGGFPPIVPSGFFEHFYNSNGVVPLCDENSQGNQSQNSNNQGCANP